MKPYDNFSPFPLHFSGSYLPFPSQRDEMSLRRKKESSRRFSLLTQNIVEIWDWFLSFGESPWELNRSPRWDMRKLLLVIFIPPVNVVVCRPAEQRERYGNVQWSIRIGGCSTKAGRAPYADSTWFYSVKAQSDKAFRRVWLCAVLIHERGHYQ